MPITLSESLSVIITIRIVVKKLNKVDAKTYMFAVKYELHDYDRFLKTVFIKSSKNLYIDVFLRKIDNSLTVFLV